VFALTNSPFSNDVVTFSRSSDGKLNQNSIIPTGGLGIGVDFDTQGGLRLSSDNKFLYAVSPATDQVTVFSVDGSCLTKVQEVYAGDQPLALSLSPDNKFAYVLDGSVASTGIFGFTIGGDGTLNPITNKTIPTSTPIGVPGTIAFSPDGKSLIVTNKVGSSIDFYSVDSSGAATLKTSTQSAGNRPFGAVFRQDGALFIVESGLPVFTNAAISTYKVDVGSGAISAVTASEKNQQTDGCWIVLAGSGDQFAYTANFVSGTISSYAVSDDASVTLINGSANFAGNGSEPVDLAVAGQGKFLYNLLRGTGAVDSFSVQDDGSLTSLGRAGEGKGLPPNNGASGLVAF
jgi:6-phosphogluconolactonase